MNIDGRLLLLVAAVLKIAALVPLAAHAAPDDRPNILFAFADDWGRHASAYARFGDYAGMNSGIETPNFDRIAERGVLFRNAFVNAPSCTPCRSSLLSGQYFWRTGRGAILQGARWDSNIPSWPLLLKDAGYHIGKTWKVWSPGTPPDAPYGGQKYAYQPAGGRFNQFSENATRMTAAGMSFEEAKRTLLEDVRANFRAFLAAREGDEPFCYWFGPTNVHRTWVRGSGRALWGIDPDALKGKLPPFLPDVPEVREDLADYFGEIQAFDAALGVLMEELQNAGELENTLVVVSGDHGAPGFPHGKCNLYDFGTRVALAVAGPGVEGGRVVDDFTILTDLAPTFLEAADVPMPDVMTASSLWPVLESPKNGLVDPQRTWATIGRERHFESARAGYMPYPSRAIRTADYLYIMNFRPDRNPLGDPLELESDAPPTAEELSQVTGVTFPDDDAGPTKAFIVQHRNHPELKQYFEHTYDRRPKEELYDLRKDPHQMQNVAGDEAYKEVQSKLREQLLNELKASGDPRMVNDGEYFETPPLAGPLPDDVERPDRRRRNR